MGQHKVLNNFASEFSSSASYSVGDLVMYLGILYRCTQSHSGAWDISHFSQTNMQGTTSLVSANPALNGDEPEIVGLEINGVKYQSQKLYADDGVTFKFSTNTGYTFAGNFASYNRMGKMITFVVFCNITKDSGSANSVELGSFKNIPNDIYAKLVGGTYLISEEVAVYEDGTYTQVEAEANWGKQATNKLTITLDTTNFVDSTTYSCRLVSVFLLTDNLLYDAVLDNNSWKVIDIAAKEGIASQLWSVGDTKTDNGDDGVDRTFRIVDMTDGIVFEEVGLENSTQWNPTTNTDSDNAYNNYYISDIRNTHLPATVLKFSNDLQSVITTTNVKVAKNGNSSTILTLTDQLFLEAEKEVWSSRTYSVLAEYNALTTFAYWATHTSANDKIKYDRLNDAWSWFLRSPRYNYDNSVCVVQSGNPDRYNPNLALYFSPCFRLGQPQTGGLGFIFGARSWSEIQAIAQSGDAANYWAIGDTKKDKGIDNQTREFRIVSMDSYGITLEQIAVEEPGNWNPSSNVDNDNCFNNYSISRVRTSVLPAILTNYSSALQAVVATTNVIVAKNGLNGSTLLTLTDKLFLEANKQLGYTSYSSTQENAALATYPYWQTHTSAADHIKKQLGADVARAWWTRSPSMGYADGVVSIGTDGYAGGYNAISSYFVAPCFRIGINEVNPVLDNNDWSTIKSICEAGNASQYWAVGDTKTDLGTDGVTRTFRIVDMSGLYNKHVVFEQVELESSPVQFDTNGSNEYAVSTMRTTTLVNALANYSNELQSNITDTTFKVGKVINGSSPILVDITDKLFLEAVKEIQSARDDSLQIEWEALTTYSYYVSHANTSDRIKKYGPNNTSGNWWTRSPRQGTTTQSCYVGMYGSVSQGNDTYSYYYAPCFSF